MIFRRNDLSRAVELHLGFGVTPNPREDFARVVSALGDRRAAAVRDELDAVLYLLGGLRPDWSRMTLADASKWAGQEAKRSFPALDKRAQEAIAWAATYGWR